MADETSAPETMSVDDFFGAPKADAPEKPAAPETMSVDDFFKTPAPAAAAKSAEPLSWGEWAKKQGAGFATGVGEVVPMAQDVAAGIGAGLAGFGAGPRYVPTEGSFGDRFSAAKKAQQAAAEQMGKEAPAAQLAGNVTGIVGSVAPLARVAAPVEAAIASRAAPLVGETIGGAAGTAASGAGLGAAQGFGEGNSLDERLGAAGTGAKWGAGIGAGLPLVAKGLGATGRALGVLGRDATEEEEAAKRLGVRLPTFIGTDNKVSKAVAKQIEKMPIGGGSVREAARTAVKDIDTAAENAFGPLAPHGTGVVAKDALEDWATTRSKKAVNKAYDAVKKVIDETVETPLTNSAHIAQEISARRAKGALGESAAVGHISDALARPKGLTFDGLKQLRTSVGEMLENPSILPAGMSNGELREIYKALTSDLRNAAQNAGGARGLTAFERANSLTSGVMERREQLAKIIGKGADAAPESVFGRIVAMSQNKSSGNLDLLRAARRSMKNDWDNVAGGVAGSLGRAPTGEFSPERFLTQFKTLQPEAKDILFGPGGNKTRDALEDLVRVSNKFRELKEFANPSGTAQGLVGVGELAAFWLHPFAALAGVSSANVVGRLLSQPHAASRMAAAVRSALGKHASSVSRVMDPTTASGAPQQALRGSISYNKRNKRADGGKLAGPDYPAKRLSRMERAAKQAREALALETKPLMDAPDEHIANALRIAEEK